MYSARLSAERKIFKNALPRARFVRVAFYIFFCHLGKLMSPSIIRKHGRKSGFAAHVRLLAPVVIVLLAPVLANAQDDRDVHPFLSKRYFTTLGIFFPDRSFKFDVDGTAPSTTDEPVDFSERFQLGGTDVTGAFEIGWRFSENWLLRGQYFRVDDSASVALNDDIEWGDVVFNSGTRVTAGTEVSITRIFVGRILRQADTFEIGIGGGLHLLEIGAFIRGNAFIDGMDAGFRDEAVSVNGPFPNIGAWYVHSLSAKWALNVRLDWLSASVDKYDGKIVNAAAGLTYALSEHFGVGLSYNYFELDLRVNDESWRGRTRNQFHGAYLFLSSYW